MEQSPTGSFLKFVIGFTVLIGVSFGVTYAVQTYATSQNASQQEAAAAAAMLR